MVIRALIVEDEPLSRQYICALLRNVPGIEIIDTAATESEAISKINSLNPDLVLLDLELHNGTGLEVARNIVARNTNIIFTTALDHQATRIIRISGIPFLQKPIDAQELESLIVLSRKRSDVLREKQFSYLQETLDNNNLPIHIHLPEEVVTANTLMNDVLLIQSVDDGCTITLADGSAISTSVGLKDFEEMLCAFHFFRPNASTIINLNHVQKDSSSSLSLSMSNGEVVDLSAKKREAFVEKWSSLLL